MSQPTDNFEHLPDPLTYDTALQRLRELTAALEAPHTSPDRLIQLTRQATWLLDWCRSRLRTIEQDLDTMFLDL